MSFLRYRRATVIAYSFFKRCYARPVEVRFVQSNAKQQNDVLERYKEKLERKAKEQGLKDLSELKTKMKNEIDKKKREFSKVDPLEELQDFEKAQKLKAVLEGKKGSKKDLGEINPDIPKRPYKTLDDYVKLDLFKKLPPTQIGLVWRARFQTKERTLCAVVDGSSYDKMYHYAIDNPRFILPLPKEDAQVEKAKDHNSSNNGRTPVEMHFIQWAPVGKDTLHLMITSLAAFKLHKEYTKPHTTVSFHSELKDSKGLVLMNGQVDKEAAVSLKDVRLLLLNLQRFYGAMGDSTDISQQRIKLVHDFNQGSGEFDIEKFLELSESMEN